MHRGRSTTDTRAEHDDVLEHLRRSVTPQAREALNLLTSDPALVLTAAGKLNRSKLAAALSVTPKVADEIIAELKEVLGGSVPQ